MTLLTQAAEDARAALPRSLPFALYIAFLAILPWLRAALPAGWDGRWLYGVQIGAVLLALLAFAPRFGELRPVVLSGRAMATAILVGAGVFVGWIHLDAAWATFGRAGSGFDPRTPAGDIDWPLAMLRLFGAAAVVPVMEELFWRSFILRWIDEAAFLRLAPAAISLRALVISAALFGIEHTLWCAGIMAGLTYGALYRQSGTLWSPILAHATTNLLLGIWVLATGRWWFW
ncbi:CAAX prenyl protease-related protein [Rhodocyclus tenuis]|uniref:CAAX prenyl protease-related protein n=1 Tax=Rhodocyclus gracilis TaxID=2929842 RepID=A0ABX0WG66_9RHOO|nr:CAAX prenyl protease-related protein [Rhodocyclus gracilis]NJA88722.1 CAAX prenyl protease-related protein [Rhodocyclus gracilis]